MGTVSDSLLGVIDGSLNLAPGGQAVYNVSRTVLATDPDPLVNTATVTTSPEGFPNIIEASYTHTTDLVHPSIEIIKDVSPISVTVGDTVTYTVTITNTGDWNLENIVVSDLVDGTRFTDLSPYFADTLVPGESDTYSYQYITQGTDPSPLNNVATVHSNPVGLPNDIWDDDPASLTIIPREDETAWGKDPDPDAFIPFENFGFSNWGWTNGPYTIPENTVMELLAGQDQYAGEVIVTMDATNIYVTYDADDGVILRDLHLYIGKEKLPKVRGKLTTSPGQFPYSATVNSAPGGTYTFEISIADLKLNGDEVYIAAHAVVNMP
jgi:uncharacterized repeat protein (TIGR01451 family)